MKNRKKREKNKNLKNKRKREPKRGTNEIRMRRKAKKE